jgi:hypothetical protein
MLNKNKLRSAFQEIFDGAVDKSVDSTAKAEDQWADAYHSYAKDAVDVSGDKLSVSNSVGFRAALQFDAAKAAASPAVIALQFDLAFVTYWTGAVFSVGTPPSPAAKCPSIGGNTLWSVEATSVVVAALPAILLGLLTPIVADHSEGVTTAEKASRYADAFHTATTTAVLVLIAGLDLTPPPAGPLPVTNTCTIM